MHVFRSAALCLLIALVGGCSSGEAFVDRDYMLKSVKKQKLPGYKGSVVVCYSSETPQAERDRLAAEACEVYGLNAMLTGDMRWQCRFTVPHMATYACYNPDMRMASGVLVNPFSAPQVNAWKKEQARLKARQAPQEQDAAPLPEYAPEPDETDSQ